MDGCVGGWEEKLRIRLNSAQFKLKLPVGAELGNIHFIFKDMEILKGRLLSRILQLTNKQMVNV